MFIYILMALGALMLIPLFFRTLGCMVRIIFGILGPLLIIAMLVLLILGIVF